SLISRNTIFDCENHRLQTLVKHFNLTQREAHRALSDAEMCLDVAISCFAKMGQPTLRQLQERQGQALQWPEFSLERLRSKSQHKAIVEALEKKVDVQIEYKGGS